MARQEEACIAIFWLSRVGPGDVLVEHRCCLQMSESRAGEMQQAMAASPSAQTPSFSRHAATLKLQVNVQQFDLPGISDTTTLWADHCMRVAVRIATHPPSAGLRLP